MIYQMLKFFKRIVCFIPGYLERIFPSGNCPSKLTGKVRRIVHSKLKLFQFQIKKYYLSDTNHQTGNPSHTSNTSLV